MFHEGHNANGFIKLVTLVIKQKLQVLKLLIAN